MTEFIENWKLIIFEGEDIKYEISNKGQVRNIETGHILKPSVKDTYNVVNIHSKICAIHRLVAQYFVPNLNLENQLVIHLDNDKLNNIYTNLKWGTHVDLTPSIPTTTTNIQQKPVCRCDKDTNVLIEQYPSILDASKWLVANGFAKNIDTCKSGISACLTDKNKYNVFNAFKWQYAAQPDLEGEIWRQIIIEGVNTDGYFVSNLARVRNGRGTIYENHKLHSDNCVYIKIQDKKYTLHRLVANAFVENTDSSKTVVSHIDFDRLNNKATNLFWVSAAENKKRLMSSKK